MNSSNCFPDTANTHIYNKLASKQNITRANTHNYPHKHPNKHTNALQQGLQPMMCITFP